MADRLPQYMADLANAVPTDVVKSLVSDFRRGPASLGGSTATVQVVGAGRVIDGDDVKRGTTSQNGWVEAPSTSNWKPPGLSIMDAMMDQQDAIDRAARARELAEAARNLRALAEAEQALEAKPEPKGSGK